MIITIVAVIVCVAGALVYALSSNGKAAELGRIAFFCGLLVTLLTTAGSHVVHLP